MFSYLNNTRNVVISFKGKTPVVKRFEHPFITIPEIVHSFGILNYFTITELKRLYRRFEHPSVDKLYKLLKKVSEVDVDIKALKYIKKFIIAVKYIKARLKGLNLTSKKATT